MSVTGESDTTARAGTPIETRGLSHSFGEGRLRKSILSGIDVRIDAGEIVIVMGPSGSGKTTLLTLIGALRSVQEGSVKVLGEELHSAPATLLNRIRQKIGYVFQAHNLLESLTVGQNVEISLLQHPEVSRREAIFTAVEMVERVGLEREIERYPHELSGGQKQRVAIARALASRPQIILADEPTASLDKQSGRDVVDLIRDLARSRGVSVLLVTHDNRILDVADRIIHLEDGRLSSFTDAVAANTRQMMDMLALQNRKADLARHVENLSSEQFMRLLDQATAECRNFLHVIEMSNNEAFESMLERVLEAFTLKIGSLLAADRVSLFLLDEKRGELVSKVAQSGGEKPLEIRVPATAGIVGRAASTGRPLNVPDAYGDPLFNRAVDQQTGYRTRNILCVPIRDLHGRTFAVVQLLNKAGERPFDTSDEARLGDFAASLGVVLQSWWHMKQQRSLLGDADLETERSVTACSGADRHAP